MVTQFPWVGAHEGIEHVVSDPQPNISWVSYWIRMVDPEEMGWVSVRERPAGADVLLSIDIYYSDEDYSDVSESWFKTMREAMEFAEAYHADRF